MTAITSDGDGDDAEKHVRHASGSAGRPELARGIDDFLASFAGALAEEFARFLARRRRKQQRHRRARHRAGDERQQPTRHPLSFAAAPLSRPESHRLSARS